VAKMGLIVNRYVHNKDKKFYIVIAVDILIIAILILVGLYARGEFENGYKFCLRNVPAYCINDTLLDMTYKYYNISQITHANIYEPANNQLKWTP
jgi:hypothetical protein